MATVVRTRKKLPGRGDAVDVGPGLSVPKRYGLDIDDPDLPYIVSVEIVMDGRAPTCQRFALQQRDGGPPVTAEGVRKIPLAGIVRHSVEWVVWSSTPVGAGRWKVTDALTQSQIEAAYRATAKQKPVTEERIREAAKLYNDALREGATPTTYLAEHLIVSRSTVARLLRAARERGLLKEGRRS